MKLATNNNHNVAVPAKKFCNLDVHILVIDIVIIGTRSLHEGCA